MVTPERIRRTAARWVRKLAGEILHRFPGEENTEYQVIRLPNGKFSVTVYDKDARETLPYATLFKDEKAALAHARKLARRG